MPRRRTIRHILMLSAGLAVLALETIPAATAATPQVTNVLAVQRSGTKLVDVTYNVYDAGGHAMTVALYISADGGVSFPIQGLTVTGDVGAGILSGTGRHIVWDAGADYPGHVGETYAPKVTADDGQGFDGMVWIPAGNVRMGQTGIATPVHDFYVQGFYIDRYEVSNSKYKAFIDAGGYTTQAYWNPVGWAWRVANSITLPLDWNSITYHGGGIAGNEQFPVNGVSWWEADAYCRWASVRLPTEAEWEKAAKGGCETHGDPGTCDASDTPTYPWGEGITGPQANYYQSGDPYESSGYTTPVGYYDGSNHGGYQTTDSPSPYGLYDVAGNVWEWCSTNYYPGYPYNPSDGRENPPVSYSECCRVVRGGSYRDKGEYFLRCASRTYAGPDYRRNYAGLRCARTGSLSMGWGMGPLLHLDTMGGISGTLVDQFNWTEFGRAWPIRDARVRVRDLNTMEVYEGTTNAEGSFSVPAPGGAAYECTFSHRGYKNWMAMTPLVPPGGGCTFSPSGAGYAVLETKTVILVHGCGGDAGAWSDRGFDFRAKLAAALPAADSCDVRPPISLVPGGIVNWLGDAGGVTRQAERLSEYLQTLDAEGVRSVHLVAHSMGGLVSRQYIRTHPGKVKTLVMLGTPNHGSELATTVDGFVLMAEAFQSAWTRLPIGYVPPAGQDLEPNSRLLRDLNYDGAKGRSNWGCPDHPDETTLDQKTQYYTYAGTAYPGNLFGACDIGRWWKGGLLSELTSLWPFTDRCNNDFTVPKSSVPLRKHIALTNVHNWTDTAWGCSSGHKRAGCPPMTEDDCVIGFVSSALGGLKNLTSSEPPRSVKAADPHAGQNVGYGLRAVAPGDTTLLELGCGTADSLVFRAGYLRGTAALRLIDPEGRSITPDTALVDAQIDYNETEALQWYTIRDAVPGNWRVIADAVASPDSVTVLLMGTEHGDVATVIDLEAPELVPGATQRVAVTLLYGAGALTGASVSGTVTDPDTLAYPIVLLDDGTNGDSVAGDGVYTALMVGNTLAGQYDLALSVTGTYGAGAVLNRHARRSYVVVSRPDMELLAEGISLSPAYGDTQMVVTVALDVRNLGPATADTVRLQFLEQVTGRVFAETLLVGLGVGQERRLSANWITARSGMPEYRLGGRVSVTGSSVEANMLNNEAYRALDVVAGVPVAPPGENGPPTGADRATMRPRLEVFPNPFRSETTLRYTVLRTERVELSIFDVSGRQVRVLRTGETAAGTQVTIWDGRDASGRRVPTGVYLARLRTGSGERTDRLIMIR